MKRNRSPSARRARCASSSSRRGPWPTSTKWTGTAAQRRRLPRLGARRHGPFRAGGWRRSAPAAHRRPTRTPGAPRGSGLAIVRAWRTGSISIPWITTVARRRSEGGSDSFGRLRHHDEPVVQPDGRPVQRLESSAILSHMLCSVYTSAGRCRRRRARRRRPCARVLPRGAGASA